MEVSVVSITPRPLGYVKKRTVLPLLEIAFLQTVQYSVLYINFVIHE
jgi:hypothetical protein